MMPIMAINKPMPKTVANLIAWATGTDGPQEYTTSQLEAFSLSGRYQPMASFPLSMDR
jgi:hypothetical protein